MGTLVVDDKDLDDAALWAVIDSAAASYSSSPTPFRKPLPLRPSSPSPPFKPSRHHPSFSSPSTRPHKMPRSSEKSHTTTTTNNSSDFVVVKQYELSPYFAKENYLSPNIQQRSACDDFKDSVSPHCLSGRFPAVSLFKDYQNAAMSILEKSDYTMISGNPFIKKSGWRKIAFYFNVSFEIKDRTIEFDDNRNVQRSEFVVRAHMQGGRFSDGWGSCERREKKFQKPNNDIPSTAETRAKNRACQDLLGIGQYRPGVSHNYSR